MLDNVIAPLLPFRASFDKRVRALDLLDLQEAAGWEDPFTDG